MADIPRKVVVVVGVGGMGLSIARRLAGGRLLLLADYSDTNLKSAITALRSGGHNAVGHALDVADYDAVCQLAQEAGRLGQIEAIIHTAGVSPSMASARRIFEIDLVGTANVIEAFLPVASLGTSLVCIASVAGTLIQLSSGLERHLATAARDQLLQHEEIDIESADTNRAYGLAKRGNQLRVQGAARAWGTKGARLNSISPGVISTVMVEKELESPMADSIRAMVALSAARRLGTADDVTNAVAFLVGSESDFITGNDIRVDGGAVAALRWHTET